MGSLMFQRKVADSRLLRIKVRFVFFSFGAMVHVSGDDDDDDDHDDDDDVLARFCDQDANQA